MTTSDRHDLRQYAADLRQAAATIDRALASGRAIPDLARVAVNVHRTAEQLAHLVASIARRMSEAN